MLGLILLSSDASASMIGGVSAGTRDLCPKKRQKIASGNVWQLWY
jgi:hypothetical protein